MPSLKEHFLLDPNVVFLNHGSFGASPKPVFEAYQNWQRRLERQPVLFLGRELDQILRVSRQALGEYLNADADDLVYIPNATHGVNIIAHSLQLKPGDEILTTDHEYGACDYTWDFICGKTGAKYTHQVISLPVHSEEEIVEQFWLGVTPRTKVVYLSHITSPTALRFPVEEICRRARRAGILTVVDAAHSPGQIPVDLQALGADVVFGNCHKWLLSAKGAAFLYVRHELQHLIEPLIVSWGYNPTPETTTGSRFIDLLQWTGTKDPTAALTVPVAIQFMREHNWDEVRHECHELLRQAIERICDLTAMPSLYPLDSDFYSQMGIAPLLPSNLAMLKSRLYNEHRVEVPLIQWRDRQFIRISVQGYNTREDIDALVDALQVLLPKVAA
ncbi:MAG: aminotransferase class V-fold PLP-dependent enzyme [Chloroflexi bacterium]|nr:aminotransferase class V-fold PLP-dependent enzyme [Chloroflexota bacterium]MBI3341113.1 aminotransferase class V-fold PLP-dependent enzyme [Chloroflexota bacterium]